MEEKEVKKAKKSFYEQWWFWLIVALVFLFILCLGVSENYETQQTTEDEQINNTTDTLNNEDKILTNPYEVTQDYNGTYSFSLSSDNGNGNMFYAVGAISFDGEKCKIKYEKSGDTLTFENTVEYEGFCGINKDSNSAFYFTIKDKNEEELSTYECTNEGKNLVCELKSTFDLAGCTNNQLNLTYVNDTQDIYTAYSNIVSQEKSKREAEEKAKKEKEEADFKSSCQTYTFEQMARNPENFKGTNVKVTGEVIQALYGTSGVDLRVNITREGTYTTYYTDTIYVTYYPEEGEDKILEDDIITIYGTSQGDYTYTSTIGASITLPLIYGKYIEIN